MSRPSRPVRLRLHLEDVARTIARDQPSTVDEWVNGLASEAAEPECTNPALLLLLAERLRFHRDRFWPDPVVAPAGTVS